MGETVDLAANVMRHKNHIQFFLICIWGAEWNGIVVKSNEDVAGEYFGIKDFPDLLNKGDVGYGYDYSVFERFRRGYLVIETKNYGYVGMVPVGLNTVASVIFEDKLTNIPGKHAPVLIKKGDEIGYFQYGGSLIRNGR